MKKVLFTLMGLALLTASCQSVEHCAAYSLDTEQKIDKKETPNKEHASLYHSSSFAEAVEIVG